MTPQTNLAPEPSPRQSTDLPLRVIEANTPDSIRYVKDTWLLQSHSLLESSLFLSKHGPKPPWEVYERLFPTVQDKILAKSKVLVAEHSERPGQYLGCLVYQPPTEGTPPIIHFCSTKKQVWDQGVAKATLAKAGIDYRQADFVYTLATPLIRKFNLAKGIYVPFWLLT